MANTFYASTTSDLAALTWTPVVTVPANHWQYQQVSIMNRTTYWAQISVGLSVTSTGPLANGEYLVGPTFPLAPNSRMDLPGGQLAVGGETLKIQSSIAGVNIRVAYEDNN